MTNLTNRAYNVHSCMDNNKNAFVQCSVNFLNKKVSLVMLDKCKVVFDNRWHCKGG